MSNWFFIKFTNPIDASEPIGRIQNTVKKMYSANNWPESMGVFMYNNQSTMETILYLTPNLHEISQSLNATPCKKPSSDGLSLVVGDQKSFKYHFGEN